MSTESIMTKRGARYKGEIGFFPDNPMAQEDIALASMNSEVIVDWYSPKNLEALKFLWALVHKCADNSDRYLDKDEAMKDLKMRAGFTRLLYNNKKGELELRPKSLARANNEQLRALTEKIITIICADVIPGMKANHLRAEVEEMCRVTTAY